MLAFGRDLGHVEAHRQGDQRLGARGLQKRGVQVLPMRDPVGRAVTRRDPAPQGKPRQLIAARAVAHADGFRRADARAQRLRHLQLLQDACAVGADLDAGALLVESRAPLEHMRGDAASRECDGRSEPADAGAGDQHRLDATLARARERRFRGLVRRRRCKGSLRGHVGERTGRLGVR